MRPLKILTQQLLDQTASRSLAQSRYSVRFLLDWVRIAVALTGTGLIITAVLAFQQFLIEIYTARWQMGLLFALIGLMVALLLGQCRFNQNSITATNWSAMSSLIVTLLGVGVVMCILTTAPPVT